MRTARTGSAATSDTLSRRYWATALGSALGWRPALALFGVAGLVVLGLIATQRVVLESHRAADGKGHPCAAACISSCSRPILLCFGYFVFQTIAGMGIQTLGALALNVTLRRAAWPLAASAVTAYLLGSTAGILAGGFLAARTTHHDRVAAAGLLGRRAADRHRCERSSAALRCCRSSR